MAITVFYKKLILATIVTAGLLLLLGTHDRVSSYLDLGWYSISIFVVLSIVVYHLTNMLEQRTKKTGFISIVLINMLLKMILSAVIVAIYYVQYTPTDGLFIMPFLLVYVSFTVFETYFMNEQAKS